jgi:hypothetical protein
MPVLIASEKTCPQVGFSRTLLVRHDDPELQGVLDLFQDERGCSPPLSVEIDHLCQVDVGQRIAGDH